MSEFPMKVREWIPESKILTPPIDRAQRDDRVTLFSTGLVAADGSEIFDEDIVAAKDKPEEGKPDPIEIIVDRVHWEEGAWRLGNYDGTLADFILVAVQGNTLEGPWPLNQ